MSGLVNSAVQFHGENLSGQVWLATVQQQKVLIPTHPAGKMRKHIPKTGMHNDNINATPLRPRENCTVAAFVKED
jgi:hypothetical protein